MSQKSFVKNAADEDQVKEAEVKVKHGRDLELNDIRFVLGTVQGRRMLWRYLAACGVYKSSFTGNSQTFFLEGQRNIGLLLLADIQDASPEGYLLMMQEAKKNEDKNV